MASKKAPSTYTNKKLFGAKKFTSSYQFVAIKGAQKEQRLFVLSFNDREISKEYESPSAAKKAGWVKV